MKDSEEMVLVSSWDWQTRVLHWVNALLVINLALLTLGVEGMEALGVEKAVRRPVKELHAYIGHIFIVTLMLRVLWGFIGNRHARFSDMMPFTGERFAALGRNIKWVFSGFRGEGPRTVGHDPLASLFYLALFIVLISQAVTGLLLSGAEFKIFPGVLFSGGLGEQGAEALEEVHELGLLFMYFYIAVHLLGLVIHELKERTGLFSSMIHGKKYFPKSDVRE